MDPLVIVGRIRRSHGIRGEVVVELLTESPDTLFAPGARLIAGTPAGDATEASPALHVESARPFQDLLLVAFDEIPDRTAADRWRDRYLLVPQAELTPPGPDEVFVHDLIGLELHLRDGRHLGTVGGTFEVAGRLLLEIGSGPGSRLIPWEPSFVDELDLAGKRIVMTLPEGMVE